MTELSFPDALGYADLATLVRRARTADPEGAVRLQVVGSTLAVWVGVLTGTGLFAEGAAVGVRGIALAGPPDTLSGNGSRAVQPLDRVVASAALADRFARDGEQATRLAVPPATVHAPWAGALPALTDWSVDGEIGAAELESAARDGIAEIAQAVGASGPAGSVGAAGGGTSLAGSLAVQQLRSRVWARALATTGSGDVPAGAAFAAYVLGFVRSHDAPVRVLRSGRWVRLKTRGGDVLAR